MFLDLRLIFQVMKKNSKFVKNSTITKYISYQVGRFKKS